jgi:tricorn protease
MYQMKKIILIALMLGFTKLGFSQVDARLFRYPDVSETQITFSYAGDIWVVAKDGGVATKLSSPAGEEIMPKFSPDGKTIAFSGNYNGNVDVYTIPVTGGLPERLTWHGSFDRVVDWHPDGKQVLFASPRESGKNRWNQFYLTRVETGLPEKLPLEYAEFGSFSKDGNTIVFTDKTRVFRTWKRYEGGMAPDIWMMNIDTKEAEKIAINNANDELPMIKDNKIYFLSDRGVAKRANLWVYDNNTKETKQLTYYTDYDLHFPSMGPKDIVYEAGGKLYLYNLASDKSTTVDISLVTDQLSMIPKTESVTANISNYFISHDAKRIAVEARGEIFSVPVEHGYTANLTQTSGTAERYPAWSPNGKYLAYWSDQSGEYQLVLRNMENDTQNTLSHFKNGYRYNIMWSPDSKKMVFIDQELTIKLLFIESNEIVIVDSLQSGNQYTTDNFLVNWDSNSEWFTWAADYKTNNNVIAVYNVNNQEKHILTSGYYSDADPVFSADGKYLFFSTDRNFTPKYSNYQGTWIYNNPTLLAAIPLTKDTESPLLARNDTVEIVKEKDKEEKENNAKKKKEKEEEPDSDEIDKPTKIDFEGIEERIVLLPIKAGNYYSLETADGKLLYMSRTEEDTSLKYYDLKEREEKTIISGISGYMLAANGENILVVQGPKAAVIKVSENQKMDKTIDLNNIQMTVNPKEEWAQIYRDAWRLERDFFYDKNMHGVDWDGVYQQYLPILKQCATRWDVNFVIGEMIGEMNSSHAYKGGGDFESAKQMPIGYLGANFKYDNGHYRISHIITGSPWDAQTRSPLTEAGVDVKEGDYLLAINGIPVDVKKSPYAAFENLAGKSVELLINDKPNNEGARKVVVETIKNEYRLRNLEWIESKRKRVDEATNGKVGYIYVPNTGLDGQSELVRQFMGQWTKQALIIDERWNSGGQIPDRFIELLNRKPLSYIAGRTGVDRQVPYVAHFGPKVMMINGWSGSGGDAFPDYFRKAGLGELIGTRTWGGLIGISGAPALIDGGGVTVPTFRLYDPNGEWFREGHGVDPDIVVDEDAGQLAKGTDSQLEKTIEVILDKLKTEPYVKPPHADYEKR